MLARLSPDAAAAPAPLAPPSHHSPHHLPAPHPPLFTLALALTHAGLPPPAPQVNDTVMLDIESGKIKDFVKFDVGNLAMVTGGHNNGRVGTIVHKEKHKVGGLQGQAGRHGGREAPHGREQAQRAAGLPLARPRALARCAAASWRHPRCQQLASQTECQHVLVRLCLRHALRSPPHTDHPPARRRAPSTSSP